MSPSSPPSRTSSVENEMQEEGGRWGVGGWKEDVGGGRQMGYERLEEKVRWYGVCGKVGGGGKQ